MGIGTRQGVFAAEGRVPDPSGRSTGDDVAMIAGGLVVLGLGMLVVRDGTVPAVERSVFHAVNDLPGWGYALAWPVQQLGALVLGPLVALVALVARRPRLAIAALVVTGLKLVGERLVKAGVSRQRPGTSIGPDIELRGDVHLSGESFVSGHAVLVAALAGVVTPYLPGRWKIVPWALVGAVMVGRVYVGAHNPLDVICGAALGIAIAGAVDLATRAGRRTRPPVGSVSATAPSPGDGPPAAALRRRVALALGSVGLAVVAAGCASGPPVGAVRPELTDGAITVGSFAFPESIAVAEVYSQALEAAGFTVVRAFGLGPREFVAPALAAGLVELVPEYAGTAAEFHSLGAAEPTDDPAVAHEELTRALAGGPVVALAAAPGEDANTFVVTGTTARELQLHDVSDLAGVAGQLTFGGPAECPDRPLCLRGLADVYDVRFGDVVALDTGGEVTRQALVEGGVDVALLFTTDPALSELDVVELTDDRRLQPAENITPLVRVDVVERFGRDLVTAVDAASESLTTEAVRELNRRSAEPGADLAAVVAAWRSEMAS